MRRVTKLFAITLLAVGLSGCPPDDESQQEPVDTGNGGADVSLDTGNDQDIGGDPDGTDAVDTDRSDANEPDAADPPPTALIEYDESAYGDYIDPTPQYQLPLDDDGWARVASGDSHQIVYVSNEGDNANDGLSPEQAIATLEEGRTRLNNGSSDWLLLRRGDSFDTDIRFREELHGESANRPMVVGAYGEGPRPVINGAIRLWSTHRHVVLRDIEVYNQGKFVLDVLGTIENLYIENMIIRGGESRIQGDGSNPHRGVTLRRSMILDGHHPEPYVGDDWQDAHGNRLSGIYIANVDGLLIEENFADMNGWKDGYDPNAGPGPHPPSMFNHNFYIQTSNTNLTYRGNISSRGASFGAQIRPGGVVQMNVFVANNAAFFTNTIPSLVEDNVITLAGNKGAHMIGALGWGYNANDVDGTLLRRLIVAHSTSPIGPVPDQDRANNATHELGGVTLEDVIVYGWGSSTNQPAELPAGTTPDEVSLLHYAGELLGTTDMEGLIDAFRNRDRDDWPIYLSAPAIVEYFQEGFGL